MKKFSQLLRNSRGLTLVELLAVVIILAIISTIAFVTITKVIDNAKKDAHIANAVQLINSAKLYEAGGGEIDSGVTSGDLNDAGFIGELINPWDTDDGDYEGTVNKSEDKYEVTLDSDGHECDITGQSEKDLARDRELVCSNASNDD